MQSYDKLKLGTILNHHDWSSESAISQCDIPCVFESDKSALPNVILIFPDLHKRLPPHSIRLTSPFGPGKPSVLGGTFGWVVTFGWAVTFGRLGGGGLWVEVRPHGCPSSYCSSNKSARHSAPA